ncbi:MAG: winged helix-turn-helix domain-containing protein [Chloroflexota bacterium]|nr:winged helix-turn-helix domain-containing protein [Chloroflexota bacterium]
MDSAQRDPREMTDEEAMKWMQELVNKLVEEKGSAGGACSLEAIRNPVRRNILNALEERALAINEISEKLEVTGPALRFHLNFLESSYFIHIEGNKVDLTPGGVSVVRSHKRT